MSIECPECARPLDDIEDTTKSNTNTERACVGQHTGDIYYCPDCEEYWLDNFLSGSIEHWSYL